MDIDTDECTRRWKQRVVKVCIHEDNSLNRSRRAGSSSLTIGVATVEKPYDFNDLTYRLHCSYVPAPIAISYQLKELEPGNNVMMFGWQNSDIREPKDSIDKNIHYLQAAVSKIQDKKKCQNDFRNVKGLAELINNATICLRSRGSIDVNGDVVTEKPPENTRCSYRRDMNGTQNVKCNEDDLFSDYEFDFDYDYRKNNKFNTKKRNNAGIKRRRKIGLNNIHTNVINNFNGTRRQAICQNEHSSPLVTWVGIAEMLIGVSFTREYFSADLCVEPSIFYSMYAAKEWLTCVLAADSITAKLCAKEDATLRGYNVEEKQVNWDKGVNSHVQVKDTPKEDSFETVDVQLRPQISIHSIES